MPKTDQELSGIGGWLILLAISLISTAGNLGRHAGQAAELFRRPALLPLLTPGSPDFDPRWQALAFIETIGYTYAFIPAVALIFLFFFKHRIFPVAYTIFGCCMAGLAAAQVYYALIIPTISSEFRSAFVTQSIISLIALSVWITYLFRSRRVRLTFTRSVYLTPFFPFVQSM